MAMLEVTSLGISFGGLRAVDELSMKIEKGGLVGLIGPNGAGKTTAFNMLYAMNFSTVTAAKFDFNTSILVLVFVVLGGLGNIWGSIIAATLLTLLPELLRGLSNYRMLIYAILLIAMMLFNNSSFKVRLLEKRAMRQMEKAEKAGGKKEGA